MSAMHPFVLRFAAADLDRARFRARSEGTPLAAWLRRVLRWYLEDWLPAHRHQAGGEAIDNRTQLVTLALNRRLGLPKRLLDPRGIRPGDHVLVHAAGRTLILTNAGRRSRSQRARKEGGTP